MFLEGDAFSAETLCVGDELECWRQERRMPLRPVAEAVFAFLEETIATIPRRPCRVVSSKYSLAGPSLLGGGHRK